MGHFGNKKELKLRNLKQAVRSKLLGTGIGASANLRIVTILEIPVQYGLELKWNFVC
jgi:hypothetical protein